MELKISVKTYKGQLPPYPEECFFDYKGGSIGRSKNNTFILDDEEKVLSRIQAKIIFKNNEFYVRDESSNGSYINNSPSPLGKGKSHKIGDHDIIQVGEYQLLANYILSNNHAENEWINDTENPNDDPFGDILNPKAKDDRPKQIVDTHHNIEDPIDFMSGNIEKKPSDIKGQEKKERLFKDNQKNENNKIFDKPNNTNKKNTRKTTTESTHHNRLLKNFLEGAGINPDQINEKIPDDTYITIGKILNKSIQGTMDLLQSRKETKNYLRLDQTIIGKSKNNPLKTFPRSEEVITQQFKEENPSYLSLLDAMDESFDDLKAHQFAMTMSIQQALKSTVKHYFSPKNLQQKLEKINPISSRIPLQKEVKLWRSFEARYEEIEKEMSDQFEILLDREIAKSYELYMIEVKYQRTKKNKKKY